MPWVKLDAGFPDHPKVAAAGWRAAWLYVCGLTYCSRYLTDGRIPKSQVKRLSDVPKPELEAERLVAANLWLDDDDDYIVHDYTVWQTPSEKVEREREEGRKRAKASAEARAKKGRRFAKASPEDREPDVDVEVDTSSSSSSESDLRTAFDDVAEEEEEEEDSREATAEQLAELERRWQARHTPDAIAKYGPVADTQRWRLTTLNDVLANYAATGDAPHSHPLGTPGKRPDCATCDGLSLVEQGDGFAPCPTCTTRSNQ